MSSLPNINMFSYSFTLNREASTSGSLFIGPGCVNSPFHTLPLQTVVSRGASLSSITLASPLVHPHFLRMSVLIQNNPPPSPRSYTFSTPSFPMNKLNASVCLRTRRKGLVRQGGGDKVILGSDRSLTPVVTRDVWTVKGMSGGAHTHVRCCGCCCCF